MECYNCGARLSETDFCNACGVDVRKYKKIMFTANSFYNDGLARAKVRDLSGAIVSLKQCLKFNKNHIDARNLLGLIYFEMGEAVQGVSEWVISKNIRSEKNIADDYINMIQQNQSRLDTITTTIKKFNKALGLCHQNSSDLAVIQLKKVLSLNPKYVKAHQLLALLYLAQEDYEKARRELERASKIDCGSLITKRYMSEVEFALYPGDEKAGKFRKNTNNTASSKTFKSGNEIIIQPYEEKESAAISVFVHIVIGVLIGLCATYFIVVPAKVRSAKDDMNGEITSYGEQIEKKNAEIEELNIRIAALEQSNIELQENLRDYEGVNGLGEANDYLIEAAYLYLEQGQAGASMVEEYLSLISSDYIENTASDEFKQLYGYLQDKIGGSVAQSYLDSGKEAYRQYNYTSAIESFKKAVAYSPDNEEALYCLALAYYDSGNISDAKACFYEYQSKFPDGPNYEKASNYLMQIGD